MSHSHLALQHLIHKVDSPEYRASRGKTPPWLSEFVDQVAELFEPFVDLGRVGFECAAGVDRWEVGMYLGGTEFVGGKTDGEVRFVAFQFDLSRLREAFESIDSFVWNVYPPGTQLDDPEQVTCVVVVGKFRSAAIRLRIYASSPESAGPGMRQYTDGSWEPA